MKLLLDSHVPPAVARGLFRRCVGLKVAHLRDWKQGRFLHATDADLLAAAAADSLTLVTYDLKTIPSLLRRLADEGIDHAGVILIDDSTVPSFDVGGIVAALAAIGQAHGVQDWRNRCQFVRRNR